MDLVERARDGDATAFGELARRSGDRLLKLARLILHDEALAEDATQEALVAAWRNIKGLRDPARFDAWLTRLLVNECHRAGRRERSRGRLELHVEAPDGVVSDETRGVLDRDQLARAFGRLDIDHRAVLVLSYYLGFQPEESARILGLPAGTVRSRLHRATRQMRAALDADARAQIVRGVI